MNYLENFTQKITDSGIEEEPAIVQYCKVLAAMIPSSLFVLDMVQKRFCYIKPDDLFLCGHSMEEAMTLGYDFFSKIIHPEDLPLWKSFLGNLSRTLQENSDEWSDYFGLFRLLPKYPFITKSLERYSYHRLIPVRKESGHYYLIGIVSDSKCKKIGCYRNGASRFIYQAYNPKKRGWHIQQIPLLSRRELEILAIATGEQDLHFIAEKLCLSYYTIRSHVSSIKRKLKVQDLREATDWISYLHICNLLRKEIERRVVVQQEISLSIKIERYTSLIGRKTKHLINFTCDRKTRKHNSKLDFERIFEKIRLYAKK